MKALIDLMYIDVDGKPPVLAIGEPMTDLMSRSDVEVESTRGNFYVLNIRFYMTFVTHTGVEPSHVPQIVDKAMSLLFAAFSRAVADEYQNFI